MVYRHPAVTTTSPPLKFARYVAAFYEPPPGIPFETKREEDEGDRVVGTTLSESRFAPKLGKSVEKHSPRRNLPRPLHREIPLCPRRVEEDGGVRGEDRECAWDKVGAGVF